MNSHGGLVLLANLLQVLLSRSHWRRFLPPSKDLLDFSVHEGELPDERISLIHVEYFSKSKNGMDTMLSSAATTAARDFGSYLNFKLLFCLIFNCKPGWALLVHQIEALSQCSIVVVHESMSWVFPIRFRS
jgi:hypothetical protein